LIPEKVEDESQYGRQIGKESEVRAKLKLPLTDQAARGSETRG
jgi:hypothetical protein